MPTAANAYDFKTFKIGFDPRDKERVFGYWNEIFHEPKKW